MTSSSIHNPNNKRHDDQQDKISFPEDSESKSGGARGGAADSRAYDEVSSF
jgi:hypothetical protein